MDEKATAMTGHVAYLDGFRGLAIAFLLIGHFFPIPGINFARIGVNLFFVLSGFLMSRVLFMKNTPLALFYKRRITRIFPAFFMFLLVMVLWTWYRGMPIAWREVSMAALFLNNYFYAQGTHATMPFGHIWSLSVEEQSYVLLSLIALGARRGWLRATTGLALLIALSVILCLWYWHIDDATAFAFGASYRTELAGYGIVLSGFFLLLFEHRTIPRLTAWCYPALGLLALLLNWWSIPGPIVLIFGMGIMALLLNLLPAAPASVHRLLSYAPLRKLGIWSFSIYLWQQPFYLQRYYHGMSAWLGIVLSLALGIGSYYFLENPARRYLNARWGALPRQTTARCPEPVT